MTSRSPTKKHRTPTAAERAEHDVIIRDFRLAGGVSLGLLCGGMVFYHIVEKLNWVDAFYFCTITLATVGYGDIVPHTTAGKIFTAFYVLMGIGVIATFAHLTVRRAVASRNRARDTADQ